MMCTEIGISLHWRALHDLFTNHVPQVVLTSSLLCNETLDAEKYDSVIFNRVFVVVESSQKK